VLSHTRKYNAYNVPPPTRDATYRPSAPEPLVGE
jgi:hypothetical protein